jgi:DNA-directed RNA polymerase subunit beta'
MLQVDSLSHLRINLASPSQVRGWATRKTRSRGPKTLEVTEPATMHFKTLLPEPGGLFCQKIFGPVEDFKCACGLFTGGERAKRFRGRVCDICGVEITISFVRRRRMAVIELAYPVVHTWFFLGRPNKVATLLGVTMDYMQGVVYTCRKVPIQQPSGEWTIETGGTAIKKLLEGMDDVEKQVRITRDYLALLRSRPRAKTKIEKVLKRLRILEQFRFSRISPSWMMLEAFPVLPPDLRPMIYLPDTGYIAAEVNHLYKLLIIRNNRTTRLKSYGRSMSSRVLENESHMLQLGVDSVLDNSRQKEPVLDHRGQPRKSLSDIIKGKEGRFRQNLLGKRVDYSGRSVIVAGPELALGQCGLPREMALELFRPYVLHRLMSQGIAGGYFHATAIMEERRASVWKVLSDVTLDRPVLLNRAPTLHRMGIQGFYPVISRDEVIRLHPYACPGFNADFDGDQMGVHVPLGLEAQCEAGGMVSMVKPYELRSVGGVFFGPSQDMILGAGVLCWSPDNSNVDRYFESFEAVISACQGSSLRYDTYVWVRYPDLLRDITVGELMSNPTFMIKRRGPLTVLMTSDTQLRIYSERNPLATLEGALIYAYLKTTAGRILFNGAFHSKD